MATVGTHDLPALFAAPPPPPSSETTTTTTTTATAPPPAYEPPHIITQGAEALVYRTTFLAPSHPALLKYRPPKPYRHPVLDRRLTKQRILAEARTLVRLRREGVPAPAVLACDWEAGWLLLEWVGGWTVRACLDRYLHAAAEAAGEGGGAIDEDAVPELWRLMTRVGAAVAAMHAVGVVHGDLTTSNLMLRIEAGAEAEADALERAPESALEGVVTVIDFGLASQTVQDEDKAVDLYVLERAFGSTHPAAEPLFREVLRAYGESYKGAKVVLKKLEEVRMRGRKRSMLG
ncbi:hypothetical protein GTA08_BOTSDO01586 [Neofusicoccum parvum]|nr:hypothetical protein GTA08_BOTSDO01586 [Neofusicoccum parvum]